MTDTADSTSIAGAAARPRIFGADVAKREVVIHDSATGEVHRLANTAEALSAWLAAQGP